MRSKCEMSKAKGKLRHEGGMCVCVREGERWEVKGILTAYKASESKLSRLKTHF